MSRKKEFLQNKLSEFFYTFKCSATLAILAIKRDNLSVVKSIHKNLVEIYEKLLELVTEIYGENICLLIKAERLGDLPKELSSFQMVNTYMKFLSYEYINLNLDNIEDKVCFSKMCIEFNPFDDIAFINLGQLLLKEGKYNEALAVANYLKDYTDTPPLYILLGDIYKSTGKYAQAIENYSYYLVKNKKDSDVIKKLNETYEEALS